MSSSAGVPAAKAALQPNTVALTTAPVTQLLASKLPAGKTFVYLQCGTPVCALVGVFIKQAVGEIGGKLTVLNAGSTAQTAQAAASSALALKPDAVLLGAIDPSRCADLADHPVRVGRLGCGGRVVRGVADLAAVHR